MELDTNPSDLLKTSLKTILWFSKRSDIDIDDIESGKKPYSKKNHCTSLKDAYLKFLNIQAGMRSPSISIARVYSKQNSYRLMALEYFEKRDVLKGLCFLPVVLNKKAIEKTHQRRFDLKQRFDREQERRRYVEERTGIPMPEKISSVNRDVKRMIRIIDSMGVNVLKWPPEENLGGVLGESNQFWPKEEKPKKKGAKVEFTLNGEEIKIPNNAEGVIRIGLNQLETMRRTNGPTDSLNEDIEAYNLLLRQKNPETACGHYVKTKRNPQGEGYGRKVSKVVGILLEKGLIDAKP